MLLVSPLSRAVLVHGAGPRELFFRVPSAAHGTSLPCGGFGVPSCTAAVQLSVSICPRNPSLFASGSPMGPSGCWLSSEAHFT